MTPNDLYKMTPVLESDCIGSYLGEWHINEASLLYGEIWGASKNNKRVNIKVLKDFDFDGRRFWRLATVWFDNEPIMVIQNAGREGGDHCRRFITDAKGFNDMVAYIRSLLDGDWNFDVFDPNQDDPSLTYFYNNGINDIFERYQY